jgi:EAL domain-containing protein (putative c-di-GMP-specific phosphodiesterase class I)
MQKSLMERVIEPGAITALFQPIVRILEGDSRIVAVEGLARGPKGSTLEAPDILFEFARRKNEESVVDRAAISSILREAWKLPAGLAVHLNVHASTLGRDGRFVDFLTKTSSSLGIDLKRLTLEIVEHSNFVEEGNFLAALAELRDVGCNVALDDVGVGTSNFRMMLITRPTMLKIDRYLVHGVANDAYQQATMRAIRLLADQVHADLVAEGVENEDDLKALRTLGIEFAQGFLFSRPRTAEDLIATLLKPQKPPVGSPAIVTTSAIQASPAIAPRATAWAERGGLSLVAHAS